MDQIGQFYLIDRGAFDANPEIVYIDSAGHEQTTGGYGKKMAGESITFDPGSNSAIEDGYPVWLKVSVIAGKDRTANEHYEYSRGDNNIANYAISGLTGNPHLKFLGVTTNTADSERIAAEYFATNPDAAEQQ